MNDFEWLELHHQKLDVCIKSKDASLQNQRLRVEAVIALLSTLDKKQFIEDDPIDGEDAFDNSLEQILAVVRSVAEWGGWQEQA